MTHEKLVEIVKQLATEHNALEMRVFDLETELKPLRDALDQARAMTKEQADE